MIEMNEANEVTIDALNLMLANLGWAPEDNGSFVRCHPSDTQFHGAFWFEKYGFLQWVRGKVFPVSGVPDSTSLRRFLNDERLHAGVLFEIEPSEAGMVEIHFSASFPARNLEEIELDYLFRGLFTSGIELGEEILGRFGGNWRDES